MDCSNCGFENEETANFCSNCGTELAQKCLNCGMPNEPTANFCSNCGFTLKRPEEEELKMLLERPDEANKAYQDAVHVIQQVADKLTDSDLRETFLASTAVRTIMDKSKGSYSP